MNLGTITAETLFATSTKKRCMDARAHFISIGKVEEHDRIRRHPDTCESRVFTLKEADALWAARMKTGSLLGDMGMCIYSLGSPLDTEAVFLTDDSMFGWQELKRRGWGAMSYATRGTAHGEFETWREHVDHFYRPGVEVIESVEELVRRLNGQGEWALA